MGRKRIKNKSTKKDELNPIDGLLLFCQSDDLISLSELRQKVETIQPSESVGTQLLRQVCLNKKVTLNVVEYLMNLYPEAIKQDIVNGSHLLHLACGNEMCPSSIVKLLLSKYPEAIKIEGNWGLPLHIILKRSTTERPRSGTNRSDVKENIVIDLEVVKILRDAYPEALETRDNRERNTPLFLACRRDDISLELVKILMGQDNQCVEITNIAERLPLHALFNRHFYFRQDTPPPYDVIRFLIESSPTSLTKLDCNGDNAFHNLCGSQYITIELMELFLKSEQRLIESINRTGTPLHIFCLHTKLDDISALKIAKYLYEEYPRAVGQRNINGIRPIECAIGNARNSAVAKFLLKIIPDSVNERDSDDGRLPFHIACSSGSFDTVKYLFELYPESIREQTHDGDLPLHKACRFHQGEYDSKVRFLMEKYPAAASVKGERGDLPLHRACKNNCDLSVIRFLFEAYPEGIVSRNTDEGLPLHCACKGYKLRSDVITFLATQFPYAVKSKDNFGKLPAHYACESSLSGLEESSIISLLTIYPDAVMVDSPDHGLPIHCACTSNMNLDVIFLLDKLYPKSLEIDNAKVGLPLHCAKAKEVFTFLFAKRYATKTLSKVPHLPLHAILCDKELKNKVVVASTFISHYNVYSVQKDCQGLLPLHIATGATPDLDFITKLIDQHPDAVSSQDNQKLIPLHHALRNNAPIEILQLLLDMYPPGAASLDILGRTTLHIACRYGASLQVINILLEASPQSISSIDHNSCAPIHVACRHGASIDIIKTLFEANRTMLSTLDKKRELPIHKACRGGHVSVVCFLIEANMPSCGVRNTEGSLPIFILCSKSGKSIDNITEMSAEYLETMWRLMLAHPETVRI